jgi:hypothetical protein
MIDTHAVASRQDRSIPLTEVCGFIPGRKGRKTLHYETVRQWATIGRQGVVLETFKFGGTRCTTERALETFLATINCDMPRPSIVKTETSSSRELVKERYGI